MRTRQRRAPTATAGLWSKTMKLLKIVAAVISAVMLCGCATAPNNQPLEVSTAPIAEKGCVTPPFWVVEDESTGAQIFLLGSMHAGKADTQYPEYVLEALLNSSWVAPEMDTVTFAGDFILQQKCVKYLVLSGTTAKELIGSAYDETVDYFRKNGIWQDAMDSMAPFYWASAASSLVVDKAGLDTSYGTENVLLTLAHQEGIKIREIEGGEAQYRMMGSIPMSVQLETLAQCVGDDNINAQVRDTEELFEAWSRFDDDYFSKLTVFSADEVMNPFDWQEYYDMMYTDRQQKMADFITDSLSKGELGFVFVGTMHYYAEPSMITLLEQEGYTVTAIRGISAGDGLIAA